MNHLIELRKQLTLDEKIGMIHGAGFFRTEGVPRLGIPPLKMDDGPSGVRWDFENDAWTPINDGSDRVSWLPSTTCLASTWNTGLAYDFGNVLGTEARGRGKDVILAPGINIKRTPLCGRNFEYMSEDPYLTSEMVKPLIHGIQENDVAACVKHYAVNNQELERMTVESVLDEHTLRRIYLPAFQAACLQGESYSIMGSYNRFRGEQACESSYLLQDILRDEWNYDGVVISDWGGVHSTEKAALNGLDIEMSVTPDFDDYYFAKPLKDAILAGQIPESILDEKVDRILLLMDRLHMFSNHRCAGTYNTREHQATIEQIAQEGIVLLKNTLSHLPLNKNVKTVAVIGDNAVRTHACGGGSAETNTLYDISPLLGIKMCLGGNTEVRYAPGYYIDNPEKVIGEVDWQAASLSVDYSTPDMMHTFQTEILPKRKEFLLEALTLAKECDEVIFIGGLNHAYDVEGFDRSDMKLPYGQDEVIASLLAINPKTVVVLVNGSPVEMPWLEKASSLIQTSYCGMNGGIALAQVLWGDINPSGHLTESYPITLEQASAHQDEESYPGTIQGDSHRKVIYKEGVFVGYRYYDTKDIPVAFPFGHGLSYTNFTYEELYIDRICPGKVAVMVTLKNTGTVPGKEVVQLYLHPMDSSTSIPFKELIGFQKVHLNPGEEKTLIFFPEDTAFCQFDEDSHHFLPKTGHYQFLVGSSSEDIRKSKTILI